MSSIVVNNISLEFPVYQGSSRSFRKQLLRSTTGGLIKLDNRDCIFVQALKNVSFTLKAGDRVGLIGGNGAGKTTLLRVLAGIYEPTSGALEVNGMVTPMFDIGLGIDPDATGYENILIRGMFMGLSKAEIRKKIDSIAEFAGLGDFLNIPVRAYSSGMGIRLSFAVSTCIQSEILLMDEWIMAGDAAFVGKANERLGNMVNQSAVLVLASHSEQTILEWCNKVIWMDHGELKAFGETREVMDMYKASYA